MMKPILILVVFLSIKMLARPKPDNTSRKERGIGENVASEDMFDTLAWTS